MQRLLPRDATSRRLHPVRPPFHSPATVVSGANGRCWPSGGGESLGPSQASCAGPAFAAHTEAEVNNCQMPASSAGVNGRSGSPDVAISNPGALNQEEGASNYRKNADSLYLLAAAMKLLASSRNTWCSPQMRMRVIPRAARKCACALPPACASPCSCMRDVPGSSPLTAFNPT